jgi:PIN domain nuclease of toxin-antitoxin system
LKLLLDTHVFLWWREAHRRVRGEAGRAIAEAEVVYVSVASGWEIAIKVGLKKLTIPGPVEPAIEQSQFEKLPITFGHAGSLMGLASHHRDPFDRMLIAQALAEGLTIVTHDRRFEAYGIPIIWV